MWHDVLTSCVVMDMAAYSFILVSGLVECFLVGRFVCVGGLVVADTVRGCVGLSCLRSSCHESRRSR